MNQSFFQWEYEIKGLIDEKVTIPEKIWLEKGKIFLKKDKEALDVFILGSPEDNFREIENTIFPFVKFSTLLTNNHPTLRGGGGGSISSKKDFGKKRVGLRIGKISHRYPKQAIQKIAKHTPAFLKQIKAINDKYGLVNNDNPFLKLSLEYFYDSEVKRVYSNEGFINATMSLESLFNDGDSDIKYKLTHRASFVLGLSEFDPIEVFEDLIQFYKFRSKLVHGDEKIKDVEKKGNLSRYARRAIIIMHILLNNSKRKKIKINDRKKEILREIDYAMLLPSKRDLLQKEIKKGLDDFVLKVPRTFEGNGEFGQYRVIAW